MGKTKGTGKEGCVGKHLGPDCSSYILFYQMNCVQCSWCCNMHGIYSI